VSVTHPPFGPGGLAIVVEREPAAVDVETPARRVTITSTRPASISSAVFAGRPAEEVPGLALRLHALCGQAHAVAAAAAIRAATVGDVPEASDDDLTALAAERLGEHLRSVVTSRGLAPPMEVLDGPALAELRSVLATARQIDGAIGASARAAAAGTIVEGLDRLGFAIDGGRRFRPLPGSFAATLAGRFTAADGDVFLPVDRLDPADDTAVVTALAADPEGFARMPGLARRRPETGPFARAADRPIGGDGRARLAARLAEIAEAGELVSASVEDRRRAMTGWVSGGALGPSIGWAAVESPRGRLHHLTRLTADRRIAAHVVLAPTEWNFHPDGPLAATLLANRHRAGEAGTERALRIAALFDPCVGFEVVVRDATAAD
jgi:hypothetical protein